MKVLVAGFKGERNSAKLLLDKIESKFKVEKLYLVNSFNTSKKQLESRLQNEEYDLVIGIGQKPNTESIYLEEKACNNGEKLTTNYNYSNLKNSLCNNGFKVEVSKNAGNYLCNHIFYTGLDFIYKNKLNTKMIFIHIPSIKNISNIDYLGEVLSLYMESSNE